MWYTSGVDSTNDVFWVVLAVGAFVLGVWWGVINKPPK